FMLALTLAGLRPGSPIHGRIHPEGFPGLDLLSDYRFFSIAHYVGDAEIRDCVDNLIHSGFQDRI
ncbi:hypothetical protein, partial [Burkholderia ubonensis]|uniref:hypothetical protein n=1 Tax=Burkholderia ubonensis TaxID=101571 RepID=UPI00076C3686